MSDPAITRCLLFPDLFDKLLTVCFHQHHGSSDGGAVLLKTTDRHLGLTARLVDCLRDGTQAGKIRHDLPELLGKRLFTIAFGNPDGNDAARLADEPVHKMFANRDPIAGDPPVSQPTLSRFENAVGREELNRLGEALADVVIARHQNTLHDRAQHITIDLDTADDLTHGVLQLSFFNGHYDIQALITAVLRPGNAPTILWALGVLRRILPRVRRASPKARSGCCPPPPTC